MAERIELNVAGGARICVPLTLDQVTPYVLLEQEDWFEDEIRFVRRWMRPGMRAVDVGASYGLYTIALARSAGAEGRVWSFEPISVAADCLRRSLDLNGLASVEMIDAAVSDRVGVVNFAPGVQTELSAIARPGASGDTVAVSAVTLDQMAAERGWGDIDFVKLDVEGHEVEAVRGGMGLFASRSPLVMLEISGQPEQAARNPLAELGYQFFRLLPGSLTLAPFDPLNSDSRYLLNVFACKPDRARALARAGVLALPDGKDSAAPMKGAWADYARRAPYSSALAARWPAKAGFFTRSDAATYMQGLAAFAAAQDASCGPEARLELLYQAYRCVSKSLDARTMPARRLSLARLAWELGWRGVAVDILLASAQRVAADAPQTLAEPFLSPSPRYEKLAAGASPESWLTCAVIEQCEKLRAFSSVYTGTEAHLLLEPLRHLALRSPEMDRRWELVRLRHGLRGPSWPTNGLSTRSEENLNPQFWSGPARAALEARVRQ